MVEGGDLTTAEGARIAALLDGAEADPHALVITPGVLQIVAHKIV